MLDFSTQQFSCYSYKTDFNNYPFWDEIPPDDNSQSDPVY